VAHDTGEGYYQAELHRIKGEMLLMQCTGRGLSRAATGGIFVADAESSAVAQAEACFHRSIQIAQLQNAKSWELRAAMSLARFHQARRQQREAHILLTRIYDRFTEGFDTKDLREAKALLEELS
jgi:predicted ATPase